MERRLRILCGASVNGQSTAWSNGRPHYSPRVRKGLRERALWRQSCSLERFKMALRDDILPLLKRSDWRACHVLLDQAAAAGDDSDRKSIDYWRAVVLQREGRN